MLRFVLTLIMLTTCLQVEAQVTPDVRKVVWGMSKEEVRNSEHLEALDIDIKDFVPEGLEKLGDSLSFLIYQTSVLELKAVLVYAFKNGKLAMVFYGFNPSHSSTNLHASDFANVNQALTGKYGRTRSDVDTATELERRARLDMGSLLSGRGYRRTVEWQTSRTFIRHQITGELGNVTHLLFYMNINHYNAWNRASQSDI